MKELFQIPVALYEVLSCVEDIERQGYDATKMKALVESIIETALFDAEAWLKIENLAQAGYKFVRSDTENLDVEKSGSSSTN